MFGKDFSTLMVTTGKMFSYGDGFGFPFKGHVKMNFLDRSTLSVVDAERSLHIQRLGGRSLQICPEYKRPEVVKKLEDSDDSEDEGGIMPHDVFETTVEYIDLTPVFACSVYHSDGVAVVDLRHFIKVIDKTDLIIDHQVGAIGNTKGKFMSLSSVDTFMLKKEMYYCTCERGNNRIQILTSDGAYVVSLGATGAKLGCFKQPESVSCRTDGVMDASRVNGEYSPVWYHGQCREKDLKKVLSRQLYRGNFVVGIRHDNPNILDVLYVAHDHYLDELTIKKDAILKKEGMFMLAGREKTECCCLHDMLKSMIRSHHLVPPSDTRPFVLIAVADTGNSRVQILKYKWTTTTKGNIYKREIEVCCVLGGYTNSIIRDMMEPVAVSYSPTGELAICDVGKKVVHLVSKKLSVIYTVSMTFLSYLPIAAVPTKRQQQRAVTNLSPQGKKAKSCKGFNETDYGVAPTMPVDQRPCALSFAADGKLAIGFNSGGVVVYKAYRTFDVGPMLSLLPLPVGTLVIHFLGYSDICALRSTCRYFHNCTKQLRSVWNLTTMRGPIVHNFAMFQFTKWCFSVYEIQRKHERHDSISSLHSMTTRSQTAAANAIPNDSPIGSPTSPNALAPVELDLTNVLYGSTIPLLDRNGNEVCRRHLEAECNDKHCVSSHDPPYMDLAAIKKSNSFLLLNSFVTCVTTVFSPLFFQKREYFILKLFEAYSTKRLLPLRSSFPKSCGHNLVVRKLENKIESALMFVDYLVVMTVLEEDFTDNNPVFNHSLFRRKPSIATRRLVPKLGALCLEDTKVYEDPLVQYDHGLNIPWHVGKEKKFKKPADLEEGFKLNAVFSSMDELHQHIATFGGTSNRSMALVDRMLS